MRLAMMSPYGAAEKQAMLEAPDLKTRAEILVAVTEIELAKGGTGETRCSERPGFGDCHRVTIFAIPALALEPAMSSDHPGDVIDPKLLKSWSAR